MKKFRTEIHPNPASWALGYEDHFMFMGSCFAEHTGRHLADRYFKIDLNPFGVLFNPVSIAGGIQRMISREFYGMDDLFFQDDLWHSFDHHSRFSGMDPMEVLDGINLRLRDSADHLRKSKALFLTFGTARVYHHLKSGKVVSNCHKIPSGEFNHQLLRVGDIVRIYTRIIQELLHLLPDLKIVFTVSPVRHWKDGWNGNQISKATLLLAVSELEAEFESVHYFPAYELFMDDLRDYRFYDSDMMHPGAEGIEYVWEKFIHCYMSESTRTIMSRVEKIQRDRSHIPRNPHTEAYQQFQKQLDQRILDLKKDFPDLELDLS